MQVYVNKKGVESKALTDAEALENLSTNKHKRPTPRLGRERSSYP